jgi:hypothetical protein
MGLLPAFITLNEGGVARLDTASDMPAFSKRGVPDPQTFLLFL